MEKGWYVSWSEYFEQWLKWQYMVSRVRFLKALWIIRAVDELVHRTMSRNKQTAVEVRTVLFKVLLLHSEKVVREADGLASCWFLVSLRIMLDLRIMFFPSLGRWGFSAIAESTAVRQTRSVATSLSILETLFYVVIGILLLFRFQENHIDLYSMRYYSLMTFSLLAFWLALVNISTGLMTAAEFLLLPTKIFFNYKSLQCLMAVD